MRRARARLRKYMMHHFKPKPQYGYINPTLLPRKEEKPDGHLLGVPYYKGGRVPRVPIPKDIPVHEFDFRYKFHRIHGSPRNITSVSSVPNKEKDL